MVDRVVDGATQVWVRSGSVINCRCTHCVSFCWGQVPRFRSPFVGAEPYQMEGLNPSTFQRVPRTERAPIRPLKAETTRTHPTTGNTPHTRFRKHPHPHGDRDRPTSPTYIPGDIGATDAQTIDKQYAPAPICNSTRTRLLQASTQDENP